MHFDNPFVIVFIASSSLSFLVDYVLNIIQFNYRKKNGRKITEDIKNYITPDEIDYLCTYNNTDCFYYFIKTPINTVVWIFFYLCGLYPFIYNIIWKLTNNIYIPLFIFELFLSIQSLIVYIPFFFLRKKILKHKMNIDTRSFSGWFISQIKANIKGFLITILPVFFMYIFFLSHFPTWWWFLCCCSTELFLHIYKKILPKVKCSNKKKSPLKDDKELKKHLRKIGYSSVKLYVLENTYSSNIYISGCFKIKKIIFTEGLLDDYSIYEIEEKLTRKLSHYKYHHREKRLLLDLIHFLQFFIINLFITSPKLYQGFGFTESNTVPTYLLPIGFVLLLRIVSNFNFLHNVFINIIEQKMQIETTLLTINMCNNYELWKEDNIENSLNNTSEINVSKIYSIFTSNKPTIQQVIDAYNKEKKNLQSRIIRYSDLVES